MFLKDNYKLENSEREYTKEGYLIVPARICRTGIYQYHITELVANTDEDRVVNVLRTEQEVFKPESIKSFEHVVVTNEHPTELSVNAKNFKKYVVGHNMSVVRDGDFLVSKLYVKDAQTIADIEAGKREVSNGYLCDIEFEAGVTSDGQVYEAVQKNIVGNHIAIVTQGRAGSICSLADESVNKSSEDKLMKIKIGNKEYDVEDAVGKAFEKMQKDLEKMQADMEEKLKKDAEEEMEKKDAEEEVKKDENEKQAKNDSVMTDEKITQLVENRADLIFAVKSLNDSIKTSGKSDKDLLIEILADKAPELDTKNKTVDYLRARLDALVESKNHNNVESIDAYFAKSTQSTKTDFLSQSEKARLAFLNNK